MPTLVIGRRYEMLQEFKERIESVGVSLSIHVGQGQIVKYEGERHDSSLRTTHFDFTFFSESARPVTISLPTPAVTGFDWTTCLEEIIPTRRAPRFDPPGLQKHGIYKVLPSYTECTKRLKYPKGRGLPIGATLRFDEAITGAYDGIEIYHFSSADNPTDYYGLTIMDSEPTPIWSEFLELVGTSDEPLK